MNLSYPDENGHFKISPMHAGPGRNVVGLTYHLSAGERVRTEDGWKAPVMLRIEDRMAMDAEDMGLYLRRRLEDAYKQHLANHSRIGLAESEIHEVRSALGPTFDRYDAGYADALESVLLCLSHCGTYPEDIREVRMTAMDAFANHAPEPDDPDTDGVPVPTP